MNIQGDSLTLEVLKWVGIVFVAGFIGYFGRYLSMLIIDRLHKKKKADTSPVGEPQKTGGLPEKTDARVEAARLKLEKKKAKARAKKVKKAAKK